MGLDTHDREPASPLLLDLLCGAGLVYLLLWPSLRFSCTGRGGTGWGGATRGHRDWEKRGILKRIQKRTEMIDEERGNLLFETDIPI